jgi:hypothetical protein
MLYIKKGVNLGFKAFGEVWGPVYSSVYKNLLPPYSEIKIKCQDCGKEYTLEEVSKEIFWEGRSLVQFLKKKEMKNLCCRDFSLEWNVII